MSKKKKTKKRGKVVARAGNNSKEKWGVEGHYIHVRTVLLVPAKNANVAIDFVEWVLNKYFSPVKTSYGVTDDPDDVDTDTLPDEKKVRHKRGTRGFKR